MDFLKNYFLIILIEKEVIFYTTLKLTPWRFNCKSFLKHRQKCNVIMPILIHVINQILNLYVTKKRK